MPLPTLGPHLSVVYCGVFLPCLQDPSREVISYREAQNFWRLGPKLQGSMSGCSGYLKQVSKCPVGAMSGSAFTLASTEESLSPLLFRKYKSLGSSCP